MNPDRLTNLRALRSILTQLYPDESSARRIADDAGLNTQHIAFSARAIDSWHAILTEANSQNCIPALINIILDEYPNNLELRQACQAIVPPNHNLPVQWTNFVGRKHELSEIKQLLARTHLLSLTGPPGCGKTRLALEVARLVQDDYADGVWLIQMDPVQDPDLIPQVIATALGVREEKGHSLHDTVLNHLQSRQLLLLLDNCEHLVERCAELVTTLLQSCQNLYIIATTRQALNLNGEQLYPVPPLGLPNLSQFSVLDELSQIEAVQLFIERAQKVRPQFELTTENASAIAEICTQLDGLPLALELAAARVKIFSPGNILQRLEHRFNLLQQRAANRLERHQKLESAIALSYELLEENERQIFRQLSVFVGGFTIAAAATVCHFEDVTTDEIENYIISLCDKSLLQQVSLLDEEPYFTQFASIRDYGWQAMKEHDETIDTQRRHANYYLALAEKAEPELIGPKQAEWLNRLERAHDNLRAVLRWCKVAQEIRSGLRICGALWRFWQIRGYCTEGSEWLSILLNLAPPEHSRVYAKALKSAGSLVWAQGDYLRARAYYDHSLTIYQALDDQQGSASVLNNLGVVAHEQSDFAAARIFLEKSITLKEQLKQQHSLAPSFNNLGIIAYMQGDYNRAHQYCEKSLALHKQLGNQLGVADSLENLGIIARERGNYSDAVAYHKENLKIYERFGDKQNIAVALYNLGIVAYLQTDYETARAHLQESLNLRLDLGDRQGAAWSFLGLGHVAQALEDYEVALSYYQKSLTILKELQDKLGIVHTFEAFICLAAAQAKPQRAILVAGAAAKLRSEIAAPPHPTDKVRLERWLTIARQALSTGEAAQLFDKGAIMTIDQIAQEVLAESTNC
ncbi:MAG: tetratricopeptide repeat protein [Caldilineaceae bacterium]